MSRPALGDAFEELRPAIERLARARPLHRELTPESLEASSAPSDLAVIVSTTDIVAADPAGGHRPRGGGAGTRASAKELDEADGLARRRRETGSPTSDSSPRRRLHVVEQARAREAELVDQVDRLRDRLEG